MTAEALADAALDEGLAAVGLAGGEEAAVAEDPTDGDGAGPAAEGDGAGSGGEASEAETELDRVRSSHTLQQQLEALLLVADEPISAVGLATVVDRSVREVREALVRLIAEYDGESSDEAHPRPPRGFELREVAGGYRFYVRESLDPLVADFVQQQTPSRLSQAALETLAVVAYRQPISRGAIASVRAVNVDSVVRTLVGRGLITEVGHDPETGAVLYGTDDALLGHLGVSSIDELPPIAPLLDDPSEGFEE